MHRNAPNFAKNTLSSDTIFFAKIPPIFEPKNESFVLTPFQKFTFNEKNHSWLPLSHQMYAFAMETAGKEVK
jgi:hypothetical protein